MKKTFFRTLKSFGTDERGHIASVEFVLLAVPAILIVLSVVQTVMIAQAVTVLENAAYSAARSALVHRCRPLSPLSGEQSAVSLARGALGTFTCDNDEADARALTAARLALLPISASNGRSMSRQGACDFPDALIDFIVGAGVRAELREAVEHKACYAFEDGNVEVDIRWVGALSGVTVARDVPPIEATVRFRLPVFLPVHGIFSTGERSGDNSHYREISATVALL